MLLLSALLWVRLSKRLVPASWLEGLVPAHWWVKLGLVSLMGRAQSMGVFRGSCVFRITLGRLSADGWGCLPTLLVVVPEASQPWSQHWSLQAVAWG